MGKVLMDGTEKTLFENTEIGEFFGIIFLDKMLSGDTIEVRVYFKDEEDDVYKQNSITSYLNVQANPVVRLNNMASGVGVKVTARQSTGTYKEVTSKWLKR